MKNRHEMIVHYALCRAHGGPWWAVQHDPTLPPEASYFVFCAVCQSRIGAPIWQVGELILPSSPRSVAVAHAEKDHAELVEQYAPLVALEWADTWDDDDET